MSAPSRGKGLQSHRARGLCALPLSPTFSPGTRRTLATVTQVRDIPFLPLDIVISERHLELWLSSGDHKEPRLQKTEDDKKPLVSWQYPCSCAEGLQNSEAILVRRCGQMMPSHLIGNQMSQLLSGASVLDA
ncbi:uncharacterized protein ACBT57_004349 isoform 2-T2 [Dama dama]